MRVASKLLSTDGRIEKSVGFALCLKNAVLLAGVLTGSVYRDYALLKNGFPAESVHNASVLAVKTHEYGTDARQGFDKVRIF